MSKFNNFQVDRIYKVASMFDLCFLFLKYKTISKNEIHANCPFHNDTDYSMLILPTSNVYKCEKCGDGGNPINFLMKYKKINYSESLQWLFEYYDMNLGYPTSDEIYLASDKLCNELYEISKKEHNISMSINDFKDGFFYGASYVINNFINKEK